MNDVVVRGIWCCKNFGISAYMSPRRTSLMGNDIPLPKLEEGFGKGIIHIYKMVDSSIILHHSKHHSMSIALSILAHEELTKIRSVVGHIRDQEPIDLKEWKELSGGGSHKGKLEKFHTDAFNDIVKICLESSGDVREPDRKIAGDGGADFLDLAGLKHQIPLWSKLDDIKKECMYLDWKGGNWSTFDANTTKDERVALAEFLHVQVLLTLLAIWLEYENLTGPPDKRASKNDVRGYVAIRNKLEGMRDHIKSKPYEETVQTAMSFIRKYSKR